MLTDTAIRKAKPTDKAYKLSDGKGLHLFVTPAGGKHWRMRYEIEGREKVLTFGPYPEVTLADARTKRDEARAVLRDGRDPGVAKKLKAITDKATTFEVLAREWHGLNLPQWTDRHGADVLHSLERDVFPDLGGVPINDITAPMVLATLRKIEARPAIETAKRVRQRMSAVFVYAIASGRGTTDPAAIVTAALAPLIKGKQPAITDLAEVREVLRRAEETPAHPVTRLAMRFLALTVVRPGELRGARPDEIQGDVWTVPAERMKMKVEHQVPLSCQAIETLEALRIVSQGPLLFPSSRHAHQPMSENALGYLLNRAGYHHRHVPHGWRASFSTVMNERRPRDFRIVDAMLAHAPKDKIEGAYNRASYLPLRREIAQEWADLLLEGRPAPMELLGLARR